MSEKIKCRMGRMNFAASGQPDPSLLLMEECVDLEPGGKKCNGWVFPFRAVSQKKVVARFQFARRFLLI